MRSFARHILAAVLIQSVFIGALGVREVAAAPAKPAPGADRGAENTAPDTPNSGGKDARSPPNLLIIGASSLTSPVPLTQLLGAMLLSKEMPMHLEGAYPRLDRVNELLGFKQTWDYVVMDAWHFGRGRTDPPEFSAAVAEFVKQVRAHSPRSKIILFPWWIPGGPKATKEGVMEVFRRCVEEGKANDLWVATTGPAFMEARLDRPDLHVTRSKTDAHPGIHGAYLNACSLFAVIKGESPVGLPATLELPRSNGEPAEFAVADDDARYLQELAWKIYQREIKNTRPAQ